MRSDLTRLVGHGAPGQFLLDETRVDLDALSDASVREKLKSKIYGASTVELLSCRVAAGPTGRHFIRQLSKILGVRVFASSRYVGPEHLGGTYFLDYGYNPHDDREIAGYQAQPVPNLAFLLPQPENYVSVTFTRGYIGTQANQQAPQDIYTFGYVGEDTAIESITFRQDDSDLDGLFGDSTGLQGNDLDGELIIKFSDTLGEAQAEEVVLPAYLNFRETGQKNTLYVLGFLIYPSPNSESAEGPIITSTDMIDDVNGWFDYIDDGDPDNTGLDPSRAYTSDPALPTYSYADAASDPGYTFQTTVWDEASSDATAYPAGAGAANTYRLLSGSESQESSNIGLVLENITLPTQPTNYQDRSSLTNAANNGLLEALNDYLRDVKPISVSDPVFLETNDTTETDDCELAYRIVLPETATATSSSTYAYEITPGTGINAGDGATDWDGGFNLDNAELGDGTSLSREPLVVAGEWSFTDGSSTYTFYDNGDGTITVPQGVTAFDFCINVLQDTVEENTEIITVNFGSVVGTGTITDDDSPVRINNVLVNESSEWAIFCAEFNADPLNDFSVDSPVDSGTANNINLDSNGGISNAVIEVWDEIGGSWVDAATGPFTDASFNNGSTPADGDPLKAYIRVRIINERDLELDTGEQFALTVNYGSDSTVGTGTIVDDGTGDVFVTGGADPNDGEYVYNWDGTNYNNQLDDDRNITIDSPCAAEVSEFIVFTLTASAFQFTKLALVSGSAISGDDFGTTLQFWDETNGNWSNYTADSFVQFNSNGRLLVRASIIDDGNTSEGAEIFQLEATNTGLNTFYGTGTIADDGSCRTIFTGDDPTGPPLTPVTSTLLSINDVVVNEASDYAVFCVEFDAVLGASLSDLKVVDNIAGTTGNIDGDDLLNDQNGPRQPIIEVWDAQAGDWIPYDPLVNPNFSNQQLLGANFINEGEPVKVFVRVDISTEQDPELDTSEIYALEVTYGTTDATTAVSGLLTIEDDGTEDLFDEPAPGDPPTATPSFDWTGVFSPDLDDDRPLFVSDSCASELSPYNVFTITGSPNQYALLEVVSGTPVGEATAGDDFSTAIEYWNWINGEWQVLAGQNYIQLDANGYGLVRHAINLDADDEGVESYIMRAYNTGDSVFEGTGEISDDGACVTLFPDVAAIVDPSANNPVAVQGELEINDIIVNEASDYAISQICGVSDNGGQNSDFGGIFIPEIVVTPDPTRPPDAITDYNLEYWDGNTWQDASNGAALAADGCLYLRTTISEEQDEPHESAEIYNLVIPGMASGNVKIVDSGNGVVYQGPITTNGTPATSTQNLDDDSSPFKGILDCSWDVDFVGIGGSYVGLAEHEFLDVHLGVLENAFGYYDLVVL